MKRKGAFFIFGFGLIWSLFCLVADGFWGYVAVRQLRSVGFSTVVGRVLQSEVVANHGDGVTYAPRVRYEYYVGDLRYESERVNYMGGSESNGRWAKEIVLDRPVGASIPVYYDPDRPAEAVLLRGLTGSDLFAALFLTPFNCMMIGIWVACWHVCRPVDRHGGVRVSETIEGTMIERPRSSAFEVSLVAIGITAFLLIFPICIGFGFNAPLEVVLVGWAVVAAIGSWMFLRRRRKLRHPDPQFRIDPRGRTFTFLHGAEEALPSLRKNGQSKKSRQPPVVVPFVAIREVVVRRVDNDDVTQYIPTMVAVLPGEAVAKEIPLGDSWDEIDAEQFVRWLQQQVLIGRA